MLQSAHNNAFTQGAGTRCAWYLYELLCPCCCSIRHGYCHCSGALQHCTSSWRCPHALCMQQLLTPQANSYCPLHSACTGCSKLKLPTHHASPTQCSYESCSILHPGKPEGCTNRPTCCFVRHLSTLCLRYAWVLVWRHNCTGRCVSGLRECSAEIERRQQCRGVGSGIRYICGLWAPHADK